MKAINIIREYKIIVIILFFLCCNVNNIFSQNCTHDTLVLCQLQPKIFNVDVNALPDKKVEYVKYWKKIELDSLYAGSWIIAGDIDGDKEVEIISAKNYNTKDNHYTSSVIAYELNGNILWKWGNPYIGQNEIRYDVACQIVNWDNKGINEVVLLTKDSLIVLDGKNGKQIDGFKIPLFASDCITFMKPNRKNKIILVKNRYNQIWAFNTRGKILWTQLLPSGYPLGHHPEFIKNRWHTDVMVGYSALNKLGEIKWTIDTSDIKLGKGHTDCVKPYGNKNIIMTGCSDNILMMLDKQGKSKWSLNGIHFESITVGQIYPDSVNSQIIVDIDHQPWGKSPLLVFDSSGNLLGQFITNRSRRHLLINWNDNSYDYILLGQHLALFDGYGNKKVQFINDFNPENKVLCFKGDMNGDFVSDLVFYTIPASTIYIYTNTGKKKDCKVIGSGKNFSFYH